MGANEINNEKKNIAVAQLRAKGIKTSDEQYLCMFFEERISKRGERNIYVKIKIVGLMRVE